ncbi:MAG: hypothetical protein AAGE84_02175 [Cyanobacteria bacterium P01_G01_bin.39]
MNGGTIGGYAKVAGKIEITNNYYGYPPPQKPQSSSCEQETEERLKRIRKRREDFANSKYQQEYNASKFLGKVLNQEQLDCLNLFVNDQYYENISIREELSIYHENILARALRKEKISREAYNKLRSPKMLFGIK